MANFIISGRYGNWVLFKVLREGPKTYTGNRWDSYLKKYADGWRAETRVSKDEVVATFETEEAAHAALARAKVIADGNAGEIDCLSDEVEAARKAWRVAQEKSNAEELAAIKEGQDAPR